MLFCKLKNLTRKGNTLSCIAGNRSWLLVVFPRPKIMFWNVTHCNSPVKYEFLAARRVVLMTHHECWVDRPFSYHVTGVGWEPSPPPCRYRHWVAYLNWLLALNPQYSGMLVTLTCDWLYLLILTHHHLHQLQLLPSAMLPRTRVSSSFLPVVFSLAGCILPFIQLGLELLSSSLF